MRDCPADGGGSLLILAAMYFRRILADGMSSLGFICWPT